MTVATTSSVATTSPKEKPALSPLLTQLTQSLREWETYGSPKAGIEEHCKLHWESFLQPINTANPTDLCPTPPGLPPVHDNVTSSPLTDGDAAKPSETPLSPGLAEVTRLCWTIDKAKVMLASGDQIRISPLMEVPLGAGKEPAKFKLMLKPQITSQEKGGASFKRAKGKCFIELKCEEGRDVIGNTQFSFWVGDQAPRGPIEHNFGSDVVGRLPKELELWDLKPSLGQLPRDPEAWGLKTCIPEGCLVLGIEFRVLPANDAAPCA